MATVQQLYKDLKLEQKFEEYEESSYREVVGMIEMDAGNLPKDMFIQFANKIYKRKK